MELTVFDGQRRDELSMIEVAHAILKQKEDVIDFNDLINEIQNYLGKSDVEIRETLNQFYTDLNVDGRFISLGENRWGLRMWYAIDEVDEELSHLDDDDSDMPKKKRNKINAFETDIDWNADDSEDDLEEEEEEIIGYDDEDDDEDDEVVAYDSVLKEVSVDEDDVLEVTEDFVVEDAEEVEEIEEEVVDIVEEIDVLAGVEDIDDVEID